MYKTFKKAILAKDYPLIKQQIGSIPHVDDSIFSCVLDSEDMEAFHLVSEKLQLTNPTDAFLKAGEKSPAMALELLIKYEENFKKDSDFLIWNNYDISYHYAFINESQLSRYYQHAQYRNNFEVFSAFLLNKALEFREFKNYTDVLKFLLNHKEKFYIRDEKVIQLLVEKNYDLTTFYQNYLFDDDDLFKNNLKSVLGTMIECKVDLTYDTQGYLPQLVSIIQLDNQILYELAQNGANFDCFLNRYKNKDNWLTKAQEKKQFEHDADYNRRYDIYKKFCDSHNIKESYIQLCEKIHSYYLLEDTITDKYPSKKVDKKIKI